MGYLKPLKNLQKDLTHNEKSNQSRSPLTCSHPTTTLVSPRTPVAQLPQSPRLPTLQLPYLWISHYDENCPCIKKARGRLSKNVEENMKAKAAESDTDSGKECETEEEKLSCLEFKELIKNISLLDGDLAIACA